MSMTAVKIFNVKMESIPRIIIKVKGLFFWYHLRNMCVNRKKGAKLLVYWEEMWVPIKMPFSEIFGDGLSGYLDNRSKNKELEDGNGIELVWKYFYKEAV